MDSPKISVITVCYNSENTIEETIVSVIEQTYTNIEYIIIDGKSTDSTFAIIKKYEPGISKCINEPDNGIYDAMNKALGLATGDWLFFLGSDDLLFEADTLSKVSKHLKNTSGIYFGDVLFKTSSKLYHITPSKRTLCLRNISHQSIFYPREVYQKFKYNVRYKLFADHVYNLSLFSLKSYKFSYMPITISIYDDKGRSSHANDDNYFNDLPSIVSKQLGFVYGAYVYVRLSLFKFKRALIKSIK